MFQSLFQFFRRRLCLHAYSTASKIISQVSVKVMELMKASNLEYVNIGSFSSGFSLKDTDILISGFVEHMKNVWVGDVYKHYQNLDDNTKNQIRKKIADAYFNSLKLTAEKCKSTKLQRDILTNPEGQTIYMYQYVLPNEYYSDDTMSQELRAALNETKIIIEMKSPELVDSDNLQLSHRDIDHHGL